MFEVGDKVVYTKSYNVWNVKIERVYLHATVVGFTPKRVRIKFDSGAGERSSSPFSLGIPNVTSVEARKLYKRKVA